MKIAIVGAGISGLTAALALYQHGQKDVRIYERASELAEVGAGIQLAPNAVRLMYQLGLADSLSRVSHCSAFGELRRGTDNRRLATLPYADYFQQHYGLPAYQLLRTDLHGLLLDAVQERQIEIHLGKELYETDQANLSVQMAFTDGSGDRADLLIGADGVGSVVAGLLFPEQPPRYSGFSCWRALVDQAETDLPPVDRVTVWADWDRHLVAYPVGRSSLLNLVAIIRKDQWTYDGRVALSTRAEWANAYAGSCDQVLALIEQAPESDLWGFFEQRDLPAWHRGHQLLIGDAAHAMLPNLAQGAAQGMEDAVALAQLFNGVRRPSEIETLLSSFHEQRHARVKMVQDGARWNLDFFHRQPGAVTAIRDGLMRLGGPLTTRLIGRKYHWLYCRSR